MSNRISNCYWRIKAWWANRRSRECVCSILAVVAINCFLCAPAFSQFTARVTSVQVQGNPTDGAGVPVTVNIQRTADLNGYEIVVGCASTTLPARFDGCNLYFPPGVNTSTATITAHPTKSVETVSLIAWASYALNGPSFSDPGITVPVTITPDTASIAATPSVVTPSSSNPELAVSIKNGNGTLLHPSGVGIGNPSWDCEATLSIGPWDYSSNPNVTAQTQLPLIQPPVTQVCNIQMTFIFWDGSLTGRPTAKHRRSITLTMR